MVSLNTSIFKFTSMAERVLKNSNEFFFKKIMQQLDKYYRLRRSVRET